MSHGGGMKHSATDAEIRERTASDTRPETRAELKALCHSCGAPAACIGRYEMMTESEYACDDCCGHGNEDGWCWLMSDIPDEVDALLAQPTQPDAVGVLRESLNEALDWAVANRGTEHAFVTCYTYPQGEMPEWVEKAERALTTDEEGDENG